MEALIKKLLNQQGDGCVTIIAATHRTKQEQRKDELNVKNLAKEAEERLVNMFEKSFAQPIINNLRKAIASIDFSHNMEALLIFANQNISEYITLSTEVKNRVVIDKTFATRDLFRALREASPYDIFVLSRKFARLIHAYADQVLKENDSPFPIQNTDYEKLRSILPPDRLSASAIEGFFNEVDKQLATIIKNNPHPIVVATGVRNYSLFLKISNLKDLIIGNISIKKDDQKAHEIVRDAWTLVQKMLKEYNNRRLKELEKAIDSGYFLNDYTEIWNALKAGRGRILFVKKGYHQPAVIKDDKVSLIEKAVKDAKGVIEDIVDEMIEVALANGGEVVYIEGPELDTYNGIALVTRY